MVAASGCSSGAKGAHGATTTSYPGKVVTNLPNPDRQIITSVSVTGSGTATWSLAATGICSAQGSATISWKLSDADAEFDPSTGTWSLGSQVPETTDYSAMGQFSSCLFNFPQHAENGTINLTMTIGSPTVIVGTIPTLDTIGQGWDKLCALAPNDIVTTCSRSNPMAFTWTVPDIKADVGEADCPPLKPGPSTTLTSIVGDTSVPTPPSTASPPVLLPTKPCTFKPDDTYTGSGTLAGFPELNASGGLNFSWSGSGSVDLSFDTKSTIIGNLPVVTPRSVDFSNVGAHGPLRIGQFRPVTVSLDNEPSATQVLTVSSVAITGPGASQFDIAADTCSGKTMPGGAPACSVTVWFKPASTGTFTASLVIHDNSNAGQETVPVTGVAQ